MSEPVYHITYSAPGGDSPEAQYKVPEAYLAARVADLLSAGYVINVVIRTDDETPEEFLSAHVPSGVAARIASNNPFGV